MTRKFAKLEADLGPRPRMALVIEDQMVREIWVNGRAPTITIRDYDWGETDTEPRIDSFGHPYTFIRWRRPAWALGLSLYPPEQEDLSMAQPKLRTIPLDQLHISSLNMRHGRKKPEIDDILPSIRKNGIRQTLLVRPEGDGYGVVAGRRRFFALCVVAEERGTNPRIPCAIMEADDDAAAIEASLIENVARLPATDLEQFNAFGKLAKEGRTASEIAEHFGVTELKVKRILALANLKPAIRALLGKGEIAGSTAQALTLATKDQQAEWLRLFQSDNERAPMGHHCRAWVTGGESITTDVALFDVDTYEGEIRTDLFGCESVFANAAEFWKAQSAAIAERIEQYLADGWFDVQVLERGHYFSRYSHTVRPRTKRGRVYVEVLNNGAVAFHEGYVTEAEARKLDRAARDEEEQPKATRPEMTKAMADYLAQHRHGAARATLLRHPAIALRLMVAHALVGSELWRVESHDYYTKKEAVMESLATSQAAAEMAAGQKAVAQMFEAHGIASVRSNGDAYHLCEVFAALLGMDDAEILQILTVTMAKTLAAGTSVVEAVAVAAETEMATYWKPDAAFFDLLRDKRAINGMVAEIASPSTAKGCLTDTATVQKQIIANRISGEGCEANPDWRPRWMQMPPSAYVDGAGSAPIEAWDRIRGLFDDSDTDHEPGDEAAAEPVAA